MGSGFAHTGLYNFDVLCAKNLGSGLEFLDSKLEGVDIIPGEVALSFSLTKYRGASFLVFHLSVFLVLPIPEQADAKLIRAQSLYQ